MATGGTNCNESDFDTFTKDVHGALSSIHMPGPRIKCFSDQELRMVLVGKIGVGKSSTGNMLLGFNAFKAKRKAKSVTRYAKSKEGTVNDKRVVIIDTPGLYNTTHNNSRKHVQEEIKTCIELGAPGIHAIIFVLSTAMRFTSEDKKCFEDFFEIFGEMFFNYAVVVFTGADLLKKDNLSLEDYIGSDKVLKKFLDKCGNRMIPFNNLDPTPLEEETQRKHLVSTVVQMNESLKTYYTNEQFITAEENLRKMEELKRDQAIELESLRQQHSEEIKQLEIEYNERLLQMRTKIRQEIEEQHRQYKKKDKIETCTVM
ncbi:uncharacterized protein LOC127724145 [Mytilus californianus]|uniref:uncharacterized protein LOC127724145 n=1 Tax=Mytilus californianus TaxID=6549 RepID=UPI0022455722|nr:uncharacterized protein LOC127724145 [Mytilus californianus]XP_052086980.1 uncharacterized protein LOC127724145 [Mytilus californianus]